MKYQISHYQSLLSQQETQVAIKLVKDTFQAELAKTLNLKRVSAPLFVEASSGLNDHLSGVEKPISFITSAGVELEIVQSLAKWKRMALKKYQFSPLSGLYTDMNAIRPSEELDNMHSLYVDQWDWEMVIDEEHRNQSFLKQVVKKIYVALCNTMDIVSKTYPVLKQEMPQEVHFLTTQELLDLYPTLSPKERENAICQKYGAVFLMQIGYPLSDGSLHDTRAADYDDWNLNGDLLLWYEPLQIAFELSSMGIRVNKEALEKQSAIKHELANLSLPYHKAILNNELPLSIGGGIGQSRICMFILKKAHIGEVQASFWDEEELKRLEKQNITLL